MKIMRKIGILTFCAAILLSMVMTGCQSGTKQEKSTIKTVTFYTFNAPERICVQKIFPDFEKLHPDIKMKLITVAYNEFDTKLQTMIASNTEPDVTSHIGNASIVDFYSKGLLVNLTPYMQKANFDPVKAGIPQNVMKVGQFDGKTYGIPLNTYVSVLLYNKDLFDKAGVAYPPTDYSDASWTFDKIIEDAQKLTVNSSQMSKQQYGIYWQWSGGYDVQDSSYFGHDIFTDQAQALATGYPSKNNFNTPIVVNDIQRIADLTWKYKVAPTPAFQQGVASGGDPFLSGKVAMEVSGAWCLSGINDVKFKVGIAAIPSGGNDKARDVLYTDAYWIFKSSKNPDAAFQWLEFMAQTDAQKKMIELSGGNPPSNVNALPEYAGYFKGISPDDMQRVVEGGLEHGAETYQHSLIGSDQTYNLITNELSPMFNGKESAQQVCSSLAPKLDALYAQIKASKK